MDDVKFMKVLDSCDYLMEELEGLRLFDSLILDDIIEKFTSVSILHDQVQLLWSLNDLI